MDKLGAVLFGVAVLCPLAAPGLSMGEGEVRFPEAFRWCVATSAHQIEGGNSNSDWWEWENSGKVRGGETSGRAANHWDPDREWQILEEDTALLRFLNVDTYRFSVEWAKLEPEPGVFSENAFSHYRKEIDLLRKSGIRPFVTLNHFTLPLWVARRGGWEWDGIAGAFRRFTARVYEELGDGVTEWITINEPMAVIGLGYLHVVDQVFPPGKNDPKAAHRAMRNMLRAHRDAYGELHALALLQNRPVRVGLAYHFRVFEPRRRIHPLDRTATAAVDWFSNWSFLHAVETGRLVFAVWPEMAREKIEGLAGTEDFIGVNYYTRDRVSYSVNLKSLGPLAPLMTDIGWEIYPEGMYRMLKKIHAKYPKKSIFITENGLADASDSRRVQFLKDHLKEVHRAMGEGVPVEGYCHWSLMDNFEWAMGFAPRFGLFNVDYSTFRRTPRLSAFLFASITRNHGLPSAVLASMEEAVSPKRFLLASTQ